jgi:sugar/nucleoside kinase (ribokinase family)
LIAINNWSMLSGLNGIIDHVSKLLKKSKKKPRVYVDLGDPKKRLDADTRKVLSQVGDIPAETVLAMNMSESTTISLALGIKEDDILVRAEQIRLRLDVDGVVIHPVNGAALSHQHETLWVKGPYTRTPRLSTGAGDNFNAGFCLGWMAGFDPGQCLTMGVCSSGYYVRQGASPTRQQLLGFMKQWLDSGCGTL